MLSSEIRHGLAVMTAYKHHEGQMYGDLPYYEGHLCKVAFFLAAITNESQYEKYIPLVFLHDILEDTNCTRLEIKEKFGQEMLEDVIALTKRPDEVQADYLLRCAKKESTFLVKLADLQANMAANVKDGNINRANYYANRISVLLAMGLCHGK